MPTIARRRYSPEIDSLFSLEITEELTLDMPENEHTSNDKSATSEYTQPLVVGIMAGIFGFGYIYYSSGDAIRSLCLGGVGFLLLFWVVLRGNNLKKQREKDAQESGE